MDDHVRLIAHGSGAFGSGIQCVGSGHGSEYASRRQYPSRQNCKMVICPDGKAHRTYVPSRGAVAISCHTRGSGGASDQCLVAISICLVHDAPLLPFASTRVTIFGHSAGGFPANYISARTVVEGQEKYLATSSTAQPSRRKSRYLGAQPGASRVAVPLPVQAGVSAASIARHMIHRSSAADGPPQGAAGRCQHVRLRPNPGRLRLSRLERAGKVVVASRRCACPATRTWNMAQGHVEQRRGRQFGLDLGLWGTSRPSKNCLAAPAIPDREQGRRVLLSSIRRVEFFERRSG